MQLWTLAGIVGGATAAYFARVYIRGRRWERRFVESFGRMRALWSIRPVYELPSAGERASTYKRLPWHATALGDVAHLYPGFPETRAVLRWFVDRERTTLGCAGVDLDGAVVQLFSTDGTTVLETTSRPGARRWGPSAPFMKHGWVPYRWRLERMLAFHQQHARRLRGLVAIGSLDDARALRESIDARIVAWRDAQDQTVLLDRDLQRALGARYRWAGGYLRARIAPVALPAARVR
jgi:hypothetical protein